MVFHLHRLSAWAPLAAGAGQLADLLFLLVSTLITGSPAAWWSLTCSLR
jgi:hypothetical protein